MHKPIVILNSISDNYDSFGNIYTWNGYIENSTKHSILKYVDTHSDELKDKYLEFIHDLGEYVHDNKKIRDYQKIDNEFSLWWMSLIAEKSPWKSPNIIDCIKVMAIEKIVEEKSSNKIILRVDNKNLARVLKDFCKKNNIQFQWISSKNKYQKFIASNDSFYNFYNRILGFLYLSYYFLSRKKLYEHKSNIKYPTNSIFFSSYFYNLDSKKIKKGEYNSRQWGDLPKFINNLGYKTIHLENYIVSPDISNISYAKKLIKIFNAESKLKKHYFLDSYLSTRNYINISRSYLKIIKESVDYKTIRKAFKIKNSKMNLWPLIKDDWFSSFSGKTTMANLICLHLFNNHFAKMPHQKLGFYLCENIGWEKALVYAWKKYQHGKLIAVPHSTIRYWDLRYFHDKRISASPISYSQPSPDYYALNGKHAYNQFLDANFSSSVLLKSEALRYQFLDSNNDFKHNYNSKEPKILILGDFTTHQTHLMLKELKLLTSEFALTLNLTIKPHPVCDINTSDYPSLNLSVIKKPLQDCIKDFDIVFSSNTTSASLDCFLMNKKVIIFLDENNLNFSPLRGVSDVSFVSNYHDIYNELVLAKPRTHNSKNKSFFWIDRDLKKWKKIIQKFF